jgi:hypothetical protein
MLVLIMKVEVFLNFLTPVKGCGKASDICKVIRATEGLLTFLEIFRSYTINIHWMPMHLTFPVVCVAVERRYNANQLVFLDLFPKKNTVVEHFDERTHDIVSKAHIKAKPIEELVRDGKSILHPGQKAQC